MLIILLLYISATHKNRLAANFNNLNMISVGRGVPLRPGGGNLSSDQVKQRCEILVSLARGRGVARPNISRR